MTKKARVFRMQQYGHKPPFASFLPGIAGIKGIPLWCYYVNRGQGVVSFGVDNKDHAIMEFLPAHRAYASAEQTGFRTFVRRDGRFSERFWRAEQCDMSIGMNTLELEENDAQNGLRAEVCYFVLPEERLGALVRRVKLTNTGGEACRLEVLDGMPELVPYGVGDGALKNILQTAKASMQVEDTPARRPYYRVRASQNDTAQVSEIAGGNFALGFDENGALLPVVSDMGAVFAYDTALKKPLVFAEGGCAKVLAQEQNASNLLPGAFFALERTLRPGESLLFTEVIGQVENKALLDVFLQTRRDGAYFEAKLARARALTQELTDCIETSTGDALFDAYSRYTYMDNVLRGGQPIRLGENKVFYVYSRRHGDLERDYNYFSMLPEFYTQGNGNFRDVNQNRRSDTFFSPFVGRENIRAFYSLIQLDGANPLSVEMKTYSLPKQTAAGLLRPLGEKERAALSELLRAPFTPGRLYAALLDSGADSDSVPALFARILDAADAQLNASFGDGYWTDHWTYNLDLIEEYLAVFPEQERALLYEPAYTWFVSQVCVAPRAKRYAETENGVRQYHALDEGSRRTPEALYLHDAQGALVRDTLIGKLVFLCAVKFAALDPYGMGIEMEGGKPGWYDALNGLPGLLGSSMCETYELARMLDYTVAALRRYPGETLLLREQAAFLEALCGANAAHQEEIETQDELSAFWNEINDLKEAYRAQTYAGVSGERTAYTAEALAQRLLGLAGTVRRGIEKAQRAGVAGAAPEAQVCPAYFAYDVTDYTKDEAGLHPRHFSLVRIPAFLEGPVRWLKLNAPLEEKRAQYARVRANELYDKELSMYRVNASIQNCSFELGRARAFTPGWLENASIWLHMEYKYLLELLQSGLYREFFNDLHTACIPFLSPAVYKRSTLENSSFLASSANPDKSIHGRGFVARLSGSTAEFLSIWRRMFFGVRPFAMEGDTLVCRLQPAIPAYLIGEERIVRARFLGSMPVAYHMADGADHIPGEYRVERITLTRADGSTAAAQGEVRGALAQELRRGGFAAADVVLARP